MPRIARIARIARLGPAIAALKDAALQDVRYSLRGLRLRPGFTLMVALTLSLGIGANATMFGIVDRLFLQSPAAVVDPGRIVIFHSARLGRAEYQTSQPYSIYPVLAAQVPDFSGVAVTTTSHFDDYPIGRGAGASTVRGAQVSPSLFPLLGVRPYRGRFFTDDESGLSRAAPLAVISYGLWQRHFAGRADAIGSVIELGTQPYTIVGITPPGFTGIDTRDVDVWIPIAAAGGLRFAKGADWATRRNSQWLTVIARLAPGARIEHAEAQASAVVRAEERARRAEEKGLYRSNPDSAVARLTSIMDGKGAGALGFASASPELGVSKLVAAVSLLVLLIACANVANLLLVRAMNRRREIAVRLALGVSRARLVSQLLIEGVLLAALGGAGALLCAALTSGTIRRLLLGGEAWDGSGVNARTIVFTAGVALATGLLTSLLPALQASRPELTSALKSGEREGGGARSRTRATLLAAQTALAIVLLCGAGLFVRSLQNVAGLQLGVDVGRVLIVDMRHASVGMSNARAREVFRNFTEIAPRVPGVTSAATSIASSFGLGWGTTLIVPGREQPVEKHNPSQYAVTPDYFRTMGVRLVGGRTFTAADVAGTAGVAVINETAARTYWPGTSPLGQCVKLGADSMPCTTVVGVVTDARRQRLVEDPVSQIYRPLDQLPDSAVAETVSFFGYTMEVRTSGDAAAVAERLRRTLQASDAGIPYLQVRPLASIVGEQTRSWTLGARMFDAFGALALLIAAVGLYSIVTFTIAQRRHELGVRIALGASGANLVQLTLRSAMMPAIVGMAAGLGVALLAGRFIAPLLFHVSARDPLVLGSVSVLLLATAFGAALVPALRVRGIDPMLALRSS
jgi:predicted permease